MEEKELNENVMQEKETKSKKKETVYIIEVETNQEYCGIGAGGVQFANGRAEIKSERMANWFKEHEGYIVTKK